ncbi:hypothetical protein [Oceanobacillus luteolus]|uniref:Uncharacterized protein n=1 Tax=Oceanobacillus luteolus TaxID=1274358 RepID=A0ABW4HSB2_9BACI
MIKAKQLRTYVNRAYKLMKQVYIEQGYFASGSIGMEEIYSIHADKEKAEIIVDELLESGRVQIRKGCQALAFELIPEERLALIKEHNLIESWQHASIFAITENHGEIFTVLREVKARRREQLQLAS